MPIVVPSLTNGNTYTCTATDDEQRPQHELGIDPVGADRGRRARRTCHADGDARTDEHLGVAFSAPNDNGSVITVYTAGVHVD